MWETPESLARAGTGGGSGPPSRISTRGGSSPDPMEPARVTLEDLTPVRKRIQVEISATDVQAELERAFVLVARQARLPGFRPGRVPRPGLEGTFGGQVRREG